MEIKNANEVISDSYVSIARYVAKTRAYPSIIDGMKAVYRRMIFASRESKGKVKSTWVTAETMKYHNHAEAYGTLVNMTCEYGPFPLYIGYGNFGGRGFQAAASRYTSVELNDIARLMYLHFVDYSNYIEGDSGLLEPDYLPALIPYSLITGSSGMTVGLPTPEIPSFNVIDLIRYFKGKLNNENPEYPRIDVGNVIINHDSIDDIRPLYEDGKFQIHYKPVISKTEDSIIINELPPSSRFSLAHRKLKWYIENEIIDYLDETDETGSRYIYKINDLGQYPVDKLYDFFMKYLSSKVTYRMYFEHESSVYLCSFNFIANKVIENLKECAVRKFKNDAEKLSFRIDVLKAIRDLKNSNELRKIHKNSTEYFIELIKGWGYSVDVAKSVMSKSISYLTNSNDSELIDLENEYNKLVELALNPVPYISDMYDKLYESISGFYESRIHSKFVNEIKDDSDLGFKVESNRLIIGDINDGFEYFDGNIITVNKNSGIVRKSFYLKDSNVSYDIEEFDESEDLILGLNDDDKYLMLTVSDFISVIPISKISSGINYPIKLWDDSIIDMVASSSKDEIQVKNKNGKLVSVNLPSLVKSRRSYPTKILKSGDRFVDCEIIK